MGTVTDIGLRSTRIRTLSRTVVNVPNGQIANASLENLSLRDQFWFHHTVGLTYETTPAQIRSILDSLTALLTQRPDIDKPSVWVRFVGFSAFSFQIEMFAYAFAPDWPEFLNVQQELLLQIVDTIEETGAKIALPSQKTYLSTSEPRRRDLDESVEELVDRKRSVTVK
jgi:MscS family membrane protein